MKDCKWPKAEVDPDLANPRNGRPAAGPKPHVPAPDGAVQWAPAWSTERFIISFLSLSIALVSGLQELFKWESVWKEYSRRIIEIESSIGLWELEVTRASRLSDASKVDDKLFEATNWLLRAVDQSVLTEMEKFFGSPSKENNSETLKGAGSN